MNPAVIAAAQKGASATFGLVGSYMEYQAQKGALEYEANQARQNATLVRQKASRDAEQLYRQGRKFLGSQRAAVGASGSTQASSYDVIFDSARQIKEDELSIKHQGEINAISLEQKANMADYQKRMAKRAFYVNAASSLLGGGGDAYQAYQQGSKTPIGGGAGGTT